MRIVPSSYPGRAVITVLTHLDLAKLVLRYFLVEFIPIYWIFRSLSDAHHRRLFLEVLTLRGVPPLQVKPLTEEERGSLAVMANAQQTKGQIRKHRADEHPLASTAVWLFTPPSKKSGRIAYIVHRVVTIPIRTVCPFLPVLFGAVKSSTFATDALSPYFELKGIDSPLEQAAIQDSHIWSFRQFGGAALVLECIPILTLFLQFITTVAAAMWAADMEKQGVSLTKKEKIPDDDKAM